MMSKTKFIAAAAAAVVLPALSHASIFVLGTSGTDAPTSNAALLLTAGGPAKTLYIWAAATGSTTNVDAYIANVVLSLESTSANVVASNFTFGANATSGGAMTNKVAPTLNGQATASGTASSLVAGLAMGGPTSATAFTASAGLKLLASFDVSALAGTPTSSASVYFVAPSGSNVAIGSSTATAASSSEVFPSGSGVKKFWFGFGSDTVSINGVTQSYTGDSALITKTGTAVSNPAGFGAGAASVGGTAAAGNRSTTADATISISGATTVTNGLAATASGTVLGTATSNGTLANGYGLGKANTSGAASGSVKIEGDLASTTGPILVYLDLTNAADAAAVAAQVGGTVVNTNLGGTVYDVLITSPTNPASGGNLFFNFSLTGGPTVASVAVIPEPTGLAGLALAAAPALRRRRR